MEEAMDDINNEAFKFWVKDGEWEDRIDILYIATEIPLAPHLAI